MAYPPTFDPPPPGWVILVSSVLSLLILLALGAAGYGALWLLLWLAS